MRIIAGKHKNRNFTMPGWIRPTQDRLRKAVFDVLGQDLGGMSFLDLFSGSGAVGLEAVSRGADPVVFVERDPRCADLIRANLKGLGEDCDDFAGPHRVMNTDAFALVKNLAREGKTFDLVFFDPPFRQGQAKKILKTLGEHDILKPNSLVIAQHEHTEPLPSQEGSFVLIREKRYGVSILSIYRKKV